MLKNYYKWWKMVIFQNLSKHGEMLKNVGENIKNNFAVIFFYTMNIKNTIFNPKFYQHFLPSLLIIDNFNKTFYNFTFEQCFICFI